MDLKDKIAELIAKSILEQSSDRVQQVLEENDLETLGEIDEEALQEPVACGGGKASLAAVPSEPEELTPVYNGEQVLVILQRGWVFAGNIYQKGPHCRLERAACVRRWGTSEGLGEIADQGPTSETVLDKCPTVRFHELTTVAVMDCVEENWATALHR